MHPYAILDFHKTVTLEHNPEAITRRAAALPHVEYDDPPFPVPPQRLLYQLLHMQLRFDNALAFCGHLKMTFAIFCDQSFLDETRERLADTSVEPRLATGILFHEPQ